MPTSERRYALIVFDWDGTLIDSAAAIVECIQQAARDIGIAPPGDTQARHVIGLGLYDSLRIAVPELPVERHMEFASFYRRHFLAREDRMPLFPGMRELIGDLRTAGHRLAIATGKSRRGLDRALTVAGLDHAFDTSRCADESHPKPHPAMLLEIMAELEIDPGRVVMIGDTSHDLDMARAAAVDALAVSYGAHAEQDLRARRPRGCVGSVAELRAWLNEHG